MSTRTLPSRPVRRRCAERTSRLSTATPPEGYGFVCPTCELSSLVTMTRAEAAYLAQVHDRLHHRSDPTALVTDRAVCESCRIRPATVTWRHQAAGVPFALCAECAGIAPVDTPLSIRQPANASRRDHR